MRNQDFISLARKLALELPAFSVDGPIMLLKPVERVLRGVYFESSSFDARSFYVWVFFLPLFVPATKINFSFGERIKSAEGERWDADAPNMLELLTNALEQDGLPFLARVNSLCDVVDAVRYVPGLEHDPYRLEAIAYTYAQLGDVSNAQRAIDSLLSVLDSSVPWQKPMRERAVLLKDDLQDGIQVAQRRLEEWEEETRRNLRLPRIT